MVTTRHHRQMGLYPWIKYPLQTSIFIAERCLSVVKYLTHGILIKHYCLSMYIVLLYIYFMYVNHIKFILWFQFGLSPVDHLNQKVKNCIGFFILKFTFYVYIVVRFRLAIPSVDGFLLFLLVYTNMTWTFKK